jgi:predicted DNA-binding protein YlxM (UPF0122 family)
MCIGVEIMDKFYEITLLYDFYGELLTEKQKNVIELYYLNDLSLFEIAEEYDITRQAVLDMLKRTEKLLKQYEDKLHLTKLYLERKRKLDEIDLDFAALISKSTVSDDDKESIQKLRKAVAEILE